MWAIAHTMEQVLEVLAEHPGSLSEAEHTMIEAIAEDAATVAQAWAEQKVAAHRT